MTDAVAASSPASSVTTAIAAAYRRRRFAWLFASLLVTLGAGPTLDTLAPGLNPLEILLGLNLLAAIASIVRERGARFPIALGLGFVGAQALRVAFHLPGLLALTQALWLAAIVLAAVGSVHHALRSGAVDSERILAALDGYLLAGLLFGVAFWLVERAVPGSLASPSGRVLDLGGAIYFSFVTIATLGYGDIVPMSEPARGLAIVESVSGQMYLVVLVARLVGLHSQESRE